MKLPQFVVTVAIVLASSNGGIAQQPTPPGAIVPAQPQRPQRTPPRAVRPGEDPQKGTSIVRGNVLAAETGTPLRRALVNVRSADGRSGGVATTDAQGRFEIKELLGGRYTITAQKAGYVTTSYGQRRAEQPGTPLELLEGQIADKVTLSLPRGGVITGRVVDEFGDPIAGAQVNALRFRFVNNGRRLMPTGNVQSDDLGNFRIFGLAPGNYYVSAGLRSQNMMGMNMSGGSMSSNVEGYAPTYFPGTPNAAEAERIVVRVGRDTTDISFALTPTRLVTVSGRAVSSSGEPYVQAFISAMPAERYGAMTMGLGMNNAMTRPDGTFQLSGVAPGTYNLSLRPNMGGGRFDGNAEFANLKIAVGQDDLINVLLVSSRGAVARGVVVSDDGSALPVRPPQVSIFAQPIDPDTMSMGMGPNQPKVSDDLTFEIPGLSESRLIRANLGGTMDWTLKAVYHRGQDVTDTPIDFVPGRDVEGIEIVFTRKRTELSGTVTNDRGEVDTDATVLVFSSDRERWTAMTRFVRTARPAQDGRYNMRGMPPHDYLAVAVRNVEMGQWQDPDFLESVRDQAVRVSLGEGETKVQDLKVAKQ
jgi:hypothetical protein